MHLPTPSPASAGEGGGEGRPRPQPPAARRALQALACLLPLTLLSFQAAAQTTPETTTRTTEFDYHPEHGQVTLERIDPGLPTCVEKATSYDDKGNKTQLIVRPCANVTPDRPEWFAARITVNEFGARSTDEPGTPAGSTLHPAGTYLTRTQTGALNAAGTGLDPAQPRTEERAVHDIRHGAPIRQTTVAVADSSRNLDARTEYDGFGRVKRQTSALGTYVLVEYKRCKDSSPADPVCLNISQDQAVTMPSGRFTDEQGNVVGVAKTRAVSAYYVQSTPYGADGQQMGAVSRVHYDALHREIAKESQAYDGRWSRALTAYDQLGQAAISWGAHYVESNTQSPAAYLAQWTSARDLLHRPVKQAQYTRAQKDAATVEESTAVTIEATIAYRGLETVATTPAGLAGELSDGRERITRSIKNAAGQVAQTIDAEGATLTHAYDAVGQLRKTEDALGNTTTITYTAGTARFKTGMTDPDLGTWSYTYDALGQLKSQNDAKGQKTDLVYDVLGRLTEKLNPDLNARWYHDRYPDGSWCAAGLSRLCEASSGNTTVRSQRTVYDGKGRPIVTHTTLDRVYTSEVAYDDHTGAVTTLKYPSGFAVKHTYSSAGSGKTPGALERVADASEPSRVFWQIDSQGAADVFNARGQLQQARLGNGLIVQNSYDDISGKALVLEAGRSANDFVQRHWVVYDGLNNVIKREDRRTAVLTETFGYDRLDRLTQYKVDSTGDAPSTRTVTLTYNAIGSILSKSDVGGYAYNASGSAQPHAVRSAGGTSYEYDANGSLTATTGAQTRRNIWTTFNQPAQMQYADRTVSFLYDHDHKRVQEKFSYRDSGVAIRTTYMIHPDNAGGLAYEREITASKDESRHYISVGGAVIAVVKTQNSGGQLNPTVSSDPNQTQYWHRDHLGSIVAVTNASGAVAERMAFDAWGRRLKEAGGVDPSLDPAHGDRGFTGHEHLDELALVHMNGRIYDPLIGRFLSADPVIQSPDDLQNFNRYSYVLNNPLKYTDPSGNLWWHVAAFIVGAMLAHNGNQHWRMVGTLLMMGSLSAPGGLIESGMGVAAQNSLVCLAPNAFNAGMVGNAFLSATIATAATSGSNGSDIMSAGLFAVAFGAAGSLSTGPSVEKFAAHALLGCMQGAMGGGKCGPSMMAAVVGKGMTEGLPAGTDWRIRGVMTAIAGGTASVIGGGKFANGAFQAGFGYVYNACSSGQCGSSPEESDQGIGVGLEGAFTTTDQYVEFAGGVAATLAVSLAPQVAAAAVLDTAAAAAISSTAARLSVMTNEQLKAIIGPGTNRLFGSIWGSGEAQSAKALKALQEGVATKIPAVSKEQLIAYRELIARQFSETPRIIHQIRAQIIDLLLKK